MKAQRRGRGSKEIALFGAGGHAKVVIDAIAQMGRWKIRGIYDDKPRDLCLSGYPLVGDRQEMARLAGRCLAFVCVGDNRTRCAISQWLAEAGFDFATIVHPRATVAPDARLGAGTAVLAGAVINSGAILGCGVIVNTCASVDHDCAVEDFAHIAPGARLTGSVRVGKEAFIGAGAVVIPGIKIGVGAIVGAAALVRADVADNTTVVGVPAKPLRRSRRSP
ncbi:MAG: acetyltransferase [Planctomycetota bacterium]|nr:acetyltransferase [Planctomycetota bacterium]